MDKKIIAIAIILLLVVGGAYVFLRPNVGTTNGSLQMLSVQSWTYESVAHDIGFTINSNPIKTGKDAVAGYYGLLDTNVYAGVAGTTVTANFNVRIDWEKNFLGITTGWHQIHQWWYKVYEKDKSNDWHQVVGNGISTDRKTYSPMKPDTLSNPPHYVDERFSFPYYFSQSYAGGAIRVETYVKIDNGDEFLVESQEAYLYKEPMHLIVHTTPGDALIKIGIPATIDNNWKAQEISSIISGADGLAIFYLTQQPGSQIYVEVSKEGYTTMTEIYQMDNHREIYVNLEGGPTGDGTTPPDEIPDGYTVTITTNPVNTEQASSEVTFSQLNGDTSIYGKKRADGTYIYEHIQPGTYVAYFMSYAWREGTYGELKYEPKEEIVKVTDHDVQITITLDLNTAPPNESPVTDVPQSYATEFHAGKTYMFTFNYVDAESDPIKTVQIDWGDGSVESRYSVLGNNLGEVERRYLRPGTFSLRARASSVSWGGEEYQFNLNHGLSDPFKFGEWSDPLTVKVIKVNEPPDLVVYYPDVGMKGAPGVPYQFQADGFDPEGNIINYVFNWGDGTHSNPITSYGTATVEHMYSGVGTYTVTVQASDGKDVTTSTQLKDKSTGMVGTAFSVERQKLPTPDVVLFLAGRGKTAKAVITAITKAPQQMFDIFIEVTDSKGKIIDRQKITKAYSGTAYVASVEFVPLNNGDVTIKAQLMPTANVHGFLASDVGTKTQVCIGTGGDHVIAPPNIIAYSFVKGKPTHATITIDTNCNKSDFKLFVGITDTGGNTVKQWVEVSKSSYSINKYIADVSFVCQQVGRVTIQAQATSSTTTTVVVTKVIQCVNNETEGPDWDKIYNPDNNTLNNTNLSGLLYNEQSNTNKVPGFTAGEIIIVFIAITSIIVWKRRRR